MAEPVAPQNSEPVNHLTFEVPAGVEGDVERLPRPGAHRGNSLFLRTDRGLVTVDATAKKGATVLARELERRAIAVGDRIRITYLGMRPSVDGTRAYRDFDLDVLSRREPRPAEKVFPDALAALEGER